MANVQRYFSEYLMSKYNLFDRPSVPGGPLEGIRFGGIKTIAVEPVLTLMD